MDRKGLEEILDTVEDALKKAEKELIDNQWENSEIEARERIFLDLINMFGMWKKRGDCLPLEWLNEVYLKR